MLGVIEHLRLRPLRSGTSSPRPRRAKWSGPRKMVRSTTASVQTAMQTTAGKCLGSEIRAQDRSSRIGSPWSSRVNAASS
eukprot:8763992-Alexandrium_andersonii.AAC.1